ncbi:MAG: hypothetical protein ACLPX8_10195 [Bryobacteraceae bacterium]|jgi:hypothetical protein
MSKPNLVVLLIAALILIAVLGAQTKQPPPSSQIGRYQLFSGEHDMGLEGGMSTEKSILRIDTVTGNTDEWVVGRTKEHGTVDTWMPVGKMPPGSIPWKAK